MENYPKPVTKKSTQKILEQMNNTFYEIDEKKEIYGFFCFIKYKNKKIPILIINKYINNEDMEDSINVTINNKRIELIDLLYNNIDYNISIILINKNNIINFVELDDKLYEKESEMYFDKESIYIIQCNNMKDISVSYSIINAINKNKLIYGCNINQDSKYSVIFNLSNNKLIGIHNKIDYNYNVGILFKSIIKQLIIKYKELAPKFNNEIIINFKVDKESYNKELYFLNKYKNNLQELNELNTELYINNKKGNIFKKYFIPKKEGEYNIKLKFNINIKDCSYMFAGCNKIININFNSFKTHKINNMSYMFYNCENLKKFELFSFNAINVTNMEYMFYNCRSLNNLDFSSIDINNVQNMRYMFYNCENLKSFELFSFNTKNKINMEYMFYNCKSLNNIDLSFLKFKNKNNVRFMLYNCKSLNNLDLSWYYEYNNIYTNNIFGSTMTIIYNINKNEDEIKLFGDKFVGNNKDNCFLLIEGKKENLRSYWCLNKNQKEKSFFEVKLIEIRTITNMSYMFSWCNSLNNLLDLSDWDTKNVTDMSWMFYKCISLKNLPDISKWDTKNVKYMSGMFSSCISLINLPDISDWDTKNVTDMSYMFDECSSLKSLPDISKWYTKNVTNMCHIFSHCISLKYLPDISKWNTQNITDMSYMFDECSSLNILPDITKWNTKNVTDMSYMFNGCTSLNILIDISKWDTKNVKNMSCMFSDSISEKFIK